MANDLRILVVEGDSSPADSIRATFGAIRNATVETVADSASDAEIDAAILAADLVVCAVSPEAQPQLAERILRARKPLWLDQPLAADQSGLDRLSTSVQETQTTVGVINHVLTKPIVDARRAIDSGDVGVAFAMHLDLLETSSAPHAITRLAVLATGTALHLLGGRAVDVSSMDVSFDTTSNLQFAAMSFALGSEVSATAVLSTGALESSSDFQSVRLRGTRGSLSADSERLVAGARLPSTPSNLNHAAVEDFVAVVRGERRKLAHSFDSARDALLLTGFSQPSRAGASSIQLENEDTP